MRVAVTEDYGSAPVLVELPTPEAGPGELRVRVRGSSLNGFDMALAAGYLRGLLEHQFPIVLGRDFAGTVDQVGAGVTDFAVGDGVFGVVPIQPLRVGGIGEFVVVPADGTFVRIPAGLDHATAGALGLAGSAAATTVDAIAPAAGETVLVAGATGGVGALVIQLAVARGATVIATAAGPEQADHVRGLGAAHVVDHTADLAAQVRAIAPDGVDGAFHLAGDPNVLAGLLVEGGRFTTLLSVLPDPSGDRSIVATAVNAALTREQLTEVAGQIAAGRLRLPIQRSYPLDEVPRAFADFAAGTLGKIAITID